MSTVGLLAKCIVPAENREAFIALVEEVLKSARDEDGTLRYVLNQDQQNPEVLWFTELYADMDAMMVHGGADSTKAFVGQAMTLVSSPIEFSYLTPLAWKDPAIG
jgi:quinol monooxygenase YgiN